MTDEAVTQPRQSERESQIAKHALMATLDTRKRRRGVRVTAGAVGAALALALGGGLAFDSAVAGAATSASTGSSTASTPPSSSIAPGKGSPGNGRPGGPPPNGKRPSAVGTVKSVDSNSFTLTTLKDGTVTVDPDSSTAYKDRGVTNPSLSDVKVGAHVLVIGTSDNGTVTATTVVIGDPPPRPGRGDAPPIR